MKRLPFSVKVSHANRNLLWLGLIAATALTTRLPHMLSTINPSTEIMLTNCPTLAAARFEECARSILNGSEAGSAFAFASPLYILLLVPLYAIGFSNAAVFAVQSLAGIITSFAIFFLSLRTGSTRLIAYLASTIWLLYSPAVLYETALLPASLLSLLIIIWALLEYGNSKKVFLMLVLGLVAGIITGLRPPFIILGCYSILNRLLRKQFLNTLLIISGFAIPLLAVSFYHQAEDDVFSPFASSLGINLVQGHSEGATGYGPPIPEYGLIESPSENIHEVGARIAAEHGFISESEANSFWLDKALTWILSNPEDELHLLAVKLGAFLGYIPFDSYFDLQRDVESDPSMRHLVLPRSILVFIICFGVSSWLLFSRKHWYMILPFFAALVTTLGFFACERYWVPAVPVSLALAAHGIHCFQRNFNTSRLKAIAAVIFALLALLPGLIWPVPEIPEGMYLYNRAVKAHNMRYYILALTLFEEAAEASPPHSTTSVYARMEALRISQALNLEDRIAIHTQALQRETE